MLPLCSLISGRYGPVFMHMNWEKNVFRHRCSNIHSNISVYAFARRMLTSWSLAPCTPWSPCRDADEPRRILKCSNFIARAQIRKIELNLNLLSFKVFELVLPMSQSTTIEQLFINKMNYNKLKFESCAKWASKSNSCSTCLLTSQACPTTSWAWRFSTTP